ncbi:hypothetical protein HJG60_010810 [Phyllostomus discolor]|uniref:Uncharacterized protein n=1 Tax=Phyllostomus discolor TaxID=89673 RepID=A0A834ECP9_9CHIR|nr:hypothetical protein HJG60_010810 [Phyllostomus discolor]
MVGPPIAPACIRSGDIQGRRFCNGLCVCVCVHRVNSVAGRQRCFRLFSEMRLYPSHGSREKSPSSWTFVGEKLMVKKRDPEDSERVNSRPKGWSKEQCACHLRGACGQRQPAGARPASPMASVRRFPGILAAPTPGAIAQERAGSPDGRTWVWISLSPSTGSTNHLDTRWEHAFLRQGPWLLSSTPLSFG